MSTTRLLLLGVLMDRPLHGYEVRRTLELWGAEGWANVAYGSIYFGLRRMAGEGLVEVVGEESRGQGAPRTVYAITDSGEAEFHRLLRHHWWEVKPPADPFQTALTFMQHLERPELLAALRHRTTVLEGHLERLDYVSGQKIDAGAPAHIAENIRLGTAHVTAALSWLKEITAKVEQGEVP
ncbi:PadR family transcriptional regulator [Nocardia sp. NPDC051052]|uniref:PadR family transcriptional regulator n=1 Tax=Nocardia sp. NPDC051052 TaxID=3364322 RepID=UPI00378E2DDB